jgi:iron complex transport system substrate-binding protein
MNKTKTVYWLFIVTFTAALFLFTITLHDSQHPLHQNQSPSPEKPQRIVSLSPGNTEILFALGAGDKIVGVSSYSDYPPEAKNIPSVGSYIAPDIEKIISLKPDLVVALQHVQDQQISQLNRAGINVVAVDPKNMEQILTAVDTISDAIGESDRGLALHTELANKLDKVKSVITSLPPKRVFVQIWDNPLLTAGNRSFINDIVTQAGGINIAADKNADYIPGDIEMLYAHQPEFYIILSHSNTGNRSFINKDELRNVNAIKNQRIFQMEDDIMTRPAPRSFDGLIKLAEYLHKGEQS